MGEEGPLGEDGRGGGGGGDEAALGISTASPDVLSDSLVFPPSLEDGLTFFPALVARKIRTNFVNFGYIFAKSPTYVQISKARKKIIGLSKSNEKSNHFPFGNLFLSWHCVFAWRILLLSHPTRCHIYCEGILLLSPGAQIRFSSRMNVCRHPPPSFLLLPQKPHTASSGSGGDTPYIRGLLRHLTQLSTGWRRRQREAPAFCSKLEFNKAFLSPSLQPRGTWKERGEEVPSLPIQHGSKSERGREDEGCAAGKSLSFFINRGKSAFLENRRKPLWIFLLKSVKFP